MNKKDNEIYFAASIRGGRDSQEKYFQIINMLSNYGKVLTEHVGAASILSMGETRLSDPEIYERDMEWLNRSGVVVAEVTTPSLGVGYEIGKAEGHKPVLCLYRSSEGKRLSAMIAGNPNLQVESYQHFEEVPQILEKFFENLR